MFVPILQKLLLTFLAFSRMTSWGIIFLSLSLLYNFRLLLHAHCVHQSNASNFFFHSLFSNFLLFSPPLIYISYFCCCCFVNAAYRTATYCCATSSDILITHLSTFVSIVATKFTTCQPHMLLHLYLLCCCHCLVIASNS